MGNFDIIFESIYMTENLLAIFMVSTHPVKTHHAIGWNIYKIVWNTLICRP